MKSYIILGIETSCDETSTALVRRHPDGRGEILAHFVLSQLKDHALFGGVVPEIAARAHMTHLTDLIAATMQQADLSFEQLSAVAVTSGPGLMGGLIVGLMTAKAIAFAHDLPLLAINHLEAHALTPRLINQLDFPYLFLLVSGGHTQIQLVKGVGNYQRLGSTLDDALGEAFDKVGKLLGLPYPGGPALEELAQKGSASRFNFPRPLKGRPDCNFSFSGLKTAIRETIIGLTKKFGSLSLQDRQDIAAGFEAVINDVIADKIMRAFSLFRTAYPNIQQPYLVVAGGVAANRTLRQNLTNLCIKHAFQLAAPPLALCTDNAAMVAWAGAERLVLGMCDDLAAPARARWPLDAQAEPLYGSGKYGVKV